MIDGWRQIQEATAEFSHVALRRGMPVRAGASYESVCVFQARCVGCEWRHLAGPLHNVSCVSVFFEEDSGDSRDDVM